MKKLSVEEKAKAYDEAVINGSRLWECGDITRENYEYIFPELKESEDERIRKWLIDYFKENNAALAFRGISNESVLAWLEKQSQHANFINNIQVGDKVTRNEDGMLVNLSQLNRVAKKDEKQGEQKPADKVEPKFHEGEWITNSAVNPAQISSIKDGMYFTHNDTIGSNVESIDKEYHLWTIQDAKAGDVLACPNDAGDRDVVFIFKNINSDEGWVFCFCASDANGCFCTNNDYVGNSNSTNIFPATKEQRDLLFQKIKESGYEWDDIKKELKKIEQNPAWSEEDDEMLQQVMADIEDLIATETGIKFLANYHRHHDWLKSLKYRVQPKQEWSEKDEHLFQIIIDILDKEEHKGHLSHTDLIACVRKLKSLRPQSQWKPSDEQIEILDMVLSNESMDDNVARILRKLREQLNKLREE